LSELDEISYLTLLRSFAIAWLAPAASRVDIRNRRRAVRSIRPKPCSWEIGCGFQRFARSLGTRGSPVSSSGRNSRSTAPQILASFGNRSSTCAKESPLSNGTITLLGRRRTRQQKKPRLCSTRKNLSETLRFESRAWFGRTLRLIRT